MEFLLQQWQMIYYTPQKITRAWWTQKHADTECIKHTKIVMSTSEHTIQSTLLQKLDTKHDFIIMNVVFSAVGSTVHVMLTGI